MKHEVGRIYPRLDNPDSLYLVIGLSTRDGVEGVLVRRPWWDPKWGWAFWCPVSEVSTEPKPTQYVDKKHTTR